MKIGFPIVQKEILYFKYWFRISPYFLFVFLHGGYLESEIIYKTVMKCRFMLMNGEIPELSLELSFEKYLKLSAKSNDKNDVPDNRRYTFFI